MKKLKGIKFFVLFIVIVLFFAGIYYVSFSNKQSSQIQSPETIGWKTYTNSKYGFSVKYPESWEVNNRENQNTGPGDTVPSSAGIEFVQQGPNFILAVDVLENSEKLSLESFFTKWDYACCGPGATSQLPDAVKSAKTVVVEGINGKELVPPIDTVGFAVKWVLINNDNKIYIISISSAQSYSENEKELFFSKFLSTFSIL